MAESNTRKLSYNLSSMKVLVCCRSGERSNHVRSCLKTLGFSQISAAPTLVEGLDRFRFRQFTHVLFDCEDPDMPMDEFVTQVLELDSTSVIICISQEPQVDDVFGLLRAGARHFLVVPFTVDTIEEVLAEASEGPPFSDAVLNAADRNAALSAVVLNTLYRVSVLMRQAREFSSAARELEYQNRKMVNAMDMALLFCEGDDNDLLDAIVEACIARANVAATRLGRTRKKLAQKRVKEDGEDDDGEDGDGSNPEARAVTS